MKNKKRHTRSISRKLLLLMTAITAMALFFASIAVVYSGRALLLERMLSDISVLAELTGMNSSAAVMFEEPKGAAQMLENLHIEQSIVTAALYKADGELLTHYIRKDATAIPPHHLPPEMTASTTVTETAIRIVRPITVDGEKEGGIYIESDLRCLHTLTWQLILILSVISSGALLLAVGFSWRFQKLITSPIIRLTDLTRKVTHSRDYSSRARKRADDEIGTLMENFNQMMDEIESRDKALQENNQQLAEARQEAVAASKAKSSFLANMSHEIRTPMNGVLGMLELLHDTPLQDQQQEFVRTARNSAFSLLDVINDILDFSKIEAGKLEMEKVELELLPLCEDISALLSEKAHNKGIELTCFVHSDVPAVIFSDPTRLRQILLNLMGNAIKFTSVGEVALQVGLSKDISENDAVLRFSVKDTGIGINPRQQQTLFDAFSQADASTTREFGGTGLGLSISKQLIELLGGHIHVDSLPDDGATFWFELPVEIAKTPQNNALSDLGGKKVLIVDDNETNRLILEHYFNNWNIDYASHDSGKAALMALDEAHEQAFDCAVIDNHMPEMDGLQLANHIRIHPRYSRLPLLMLSSSSCPAAHQFDIFLMKPLRQTLLFKSLAKLLLPDYSRAQAIELPRSLPQFNARVLLVDDSDINQKVAGSFLDKLGADIDCCDNGKQALEAINKHDYDLVFMDCHMPVMDGYRATSDIRQWEIKNNLPHLPIIAMTANVLSGDREKCLAAGMDDYLGKPIRQQDVTDMLGKWLAVTQQKESPIIPVNSPPAANHADIEQLTRQNAPKLDFEPELYRELLTDFASQYQHSPSQIRQLLDSGQQEKARELTHRIKGTAGNLGFQEIFDTAAVLEKKIRTSADKMQLLTAFTEFECQTSRLMELICKSEQLSGSCKSQPQGERQDTERAEEMFRRLQNNLQRHSSKARQDSRNLSLLLQGSRDYPALQKVEAAINQLDYQQAHQWLMTIMHSAAGVCTDVE